MAEPAVARKEKEEEVPRVTMFEVRDRMTELVDKAIGGEAQVITRYGRDVAVLVGMKEYERLRALEQAAA